MAAKREAPKTAAQAEPENTEPKTAPEPELTKPQPTQPATKKPTGNMVEVYNPQPYFYRQPSTGLRIEEKSVADLADDDWLALQVAAGVLEKR